MTPSQYEARCGEMLVVRRRWTKAEMKTLREQYGSVPARHIAAALGRTVDAIHRRAWEWCIEMPAQNRAILMRAART